MQIYEYLSLRTHARTIAYLLLFLAYSGLSPLNAKGGKLSMGNNSLTIEQIFNKIEEQTSYVFAYSKSDFQKTGKIQLTSPNGTLKELLSQALRNTGFSYQIDGKHILIGSESASGMEKLKTETVTLSGNVISSQTSKALEGVVVQLTTNNKIRSITDSKGYFQLKNVPLGDQTIRTAHKGYTKTELTVSAATGKKRPIKILIDRDESSDTAFSEKVNIRPTANAIKDTIFQIQKQTLYLHSSPGLIKTTDQNTGQPRYALKTNLFYLGTTTPNVSFETALAKKWTLDATFGYNPWKFSPGKVQHGLVMAEARYWTCQTFERHFFGIHGIYSEFNVGELSFISSMKNYTYKGNLYGGGISYGYHFPLKGRWGMELTLGVGYIHLNYDKYECIGCKELVGSYKRNYWGPTKAGVSLVYMVSK